MKRKLAVALQISGVALAAAPAAAQTEPGDTTPAYEIEGVTVTTTRTFLDRSEISQRIDVIGREDVELSGARTALDALRANAAIDAIVFPGLLAGVSVRGFRPQYSDVNPRTLVLIDGRPAGTTNLALLDAAGIERIEVLRGPASTLYGPSAMGGVVNVVTRRSEGEPAGSISAGYGSFGNYRADLQVGGGVAYGLDFDLALSTAGQRAGYRPGSRRLFAADSLLKVLPDGGTTRLPWTAADSVLDFARFDARGARARLGYRIGDGWRVEARAELYRADDVENPGDLNVTEWDSRSLKDVGRNAFDLSLSGATRGHNPTVRLYSTRETTDYFNAPVPPHFVSYRTPIDTYGAQVQDHFSVGSASFVFGADLTTTVAKSEAFTADGVRGAPFTPDASIRTAAAFADTRFDLVPDRLLLSGGVRFDHVEFRVRETPHLADIPANRETHDVFTPGVGLRLTLLPGVQAYGNLGRAFVTPSAFNVAGYSESRAGADRSAVNVTRGNPDLRPETSRNWDVGITASRPEHGIDLDLAYFHTDVRDRIATALTPDSGSEVTERGDTILSTTSYVNVDEAEIRGVEARFSYSLAPLLGPSWPVRLFLNGTRILRAQERFAESGRTQRIRNVADHTIVAGIDLDGISRLDGRLAARYVGERVDTDYVAWWEPGEIHYPSYLVFDLHTGFRVGDRYRLSLDLRNVLDEDYFEVRGYDLPGRSLHLGLGASF